MMKTPAAPERVALQTSDTGNGGREPWDNVEGDHPSHTPVLRWMAKMLMFWALCGRPGCRRARRCKGEPRDCLFRLGPLMPDEAREAMYYMLEGKQLGLTYDEVSDQVPEEMDAFEEWIVKVGRTLERPRLRRWKADEEAQG